MTKLLISLSLVSAWGCGIVLFENIDEIGLAIKPHELSDLSNTLARVTKQECRLTRTLFIDIIGNPYARNFFKGMAKIIFVEKKFISNTLQSKIFCIMLANIACNF